MRCLRCRADNREGRQFCARCGARLSTPCIACGFGNDPGDEFCGGCGQSLGRVGAGPRLPAAGAGPDDGERRQITVMFCDLVGSTALSARLDPEELREIVRAYQAACGEVVGRLDGHVAQYLGDGLLVYFGYPVAHEDDARRAVHAALEIIELVAALPARLGRPGGPSLQVRVGIHTGQVVLGDVGGGDRRERLALGETPNVAARLQAVAEPGAALVSSATRRLAGGFFEFSDSGAHALKGIDAPVHVYRVLGEAAAPGLPAEPATALVGRERQVALLLERWQDATEHLGQVVLLIGEPGIGKSRLIRAVRERDAGTPHVRLEVHASPFHQHSPMHVAAQILVGALGLGATAEPPARLAALERAAAEIAVPPAEVVPLLAPLLALSAHAYAPLPWTPQKQKERTAEIVLSIVLALAGREPLLLVVEDLHWVDSSSLEALAQLVEQVAGARVCALFTARPEFRPPWRVRSHVSHLTLGRLPRGEVETMLGHLTDGRPLPDEVSRQILIKADGVPLFVEELTRAVLESGLLEERAGRYELTGPLPPLGVPATLQDSLAARLDRLGDSRPVAQLGATLGREFSWELLAAVSPLDDAALRGALERLVDAELLHQRGQPPRSTYTFKHALIQEEAYQSLLRSARQQHHRRIACVLEERFPSVGQLHPEILAHHYTRAGMPGQAIPHWQRAGDDAARRSAGPEAIAHFTQAIALVPALPEGSERARRELTLQIALGPVLFGARGFAAPETGAAYARAHELCAELGEISEVFPALWGLWGYFVIRGNLRRSVEIGRELLERAERTGDPGLRLQAHHALGPSHLFLGEFDTALRHFEAVSALYDRERHADLAFVYGGHDAGACALHFASVTQWMLGYPERGLGAAVAAHALAERLAHPHTSALALIYTSLLRLLRGEAEAARRDAEAAIALATEGGLPQWRGLSLVLGGAARAALGAPDGGLAQMQEGLAAYRATGAEVETAVSRTLLVHSHIRRREWEPGLALVAETLDAMSATGERLCEAELHRLRGELLVARSPADPAAAETSFHQALTVARHLGARSWELRAATSLARLRGRQGRREEAVGLLAPVLAWFTEGQDTGDLREARALLDALA